MAAQCPTAVKGSEALQLFPLPSPSPFASLGLWLMIKLCPEGRSLMEERETSKAFSGHMALEWQIGTQVALKYNQFSPHDICSVLGLGMLLVSRVKSSVVPLCLKNKTSPRRKGLPHTQGQHCPHDICQILNFLGDRARRAGVGTSEEQSWTSTVFHGWR